MVEDTNPEPDPGSLSTRHGIDFRQISQAMACGVLVVGPDLQVVAANEAASDLLGVPMNRLHGTVLSRALWEDRGALSQPAAASDFQCVPRRATVHVSLPDGARRWLQVDASPVPDRDGKAGLLVISLVDVTSHVDYAAAEALRRDRALHTMFQAMTCGVILLDPEGELLDANDAALRILGRSLRELQGSRPSEIVHWRRAGPDGHPLPGAERITSLVRRTGQPLRGELMSVDRADGLPCLIELDAVPVLEQGQLTGIVHSFIDVTARHAAEAAVRADAARLALEYDVTRVLDQDRPLEQVIVDLLRTIGIHQDWDCASYWTLDAGAGVLRCQEGWCAVASPLAPYLEHGKTLVLAPGTGLAGKVWEQRTAIWLEDVTRGNVFYDTTHAVAAGVRSAMAFPVLIGDTIHGVIAFDSLHTAPLNRALLQTFAALGALIAASIERLETRMMLAQSAQRFRQLVELAPVGACLMDQEGVLELVNAAFAATYDYTGVRLVGHNFALLLPEERREAVLHAIRMPDPGGAAIQIESEGRTRSGRRILTSIASMQVSSPEDLGRFALFVVDITERKRAEQELLHLVLYDHVTGLPNRGLFRGRLLHAIEHARRYERQVAVLFLDLDGFKAVNDSYGHTAGDRLLRAVGARLQSCLRAADVVARHSGDEFTIVLGEIAGRDAAVAVTQKVLEAVAAPFDVEDHTVWVTASVGISLFPEHGSEIDDLLATADAAMYRAKHAGKNRYALLDG